MIKFIKTENAPAAVGPYSQGVMGGNVLFISGQLPADPKGGEPIAGDIKKAARQSLENMKAIVEEAGGSIHNICKVNVFVRDISKFSDVNEVYADFFGDHKPARSLVEVSGMPKNAEIEIEAIAVIG